jgi:hypothetical protein
MGRHFTEELGCASSGPHPIEENVVDCNALTIPVKHQPEPPTLSLPIQSSGSSLGLHNTLECLRVGAANLELEPAVLLLLWQLNAKTTSLMGILPRRSLITPP